MRYKVTLKPIMKSQMGDTKLEIQSQMWDLSPNQLKCMDDLSSLACEKIIEHICLSWIIKVSKFVFATCIKVHSCMIALKVCSILSFESAWIRSPLKKATQMHKEGEMLLWKTKV